jgi:DNA-binding transcriptional LysR family regulator
MRIDFLGLQAFVSVAERGSFLRAAVHLNLSQTALSHRMKKLEEDLGVALLTRTTRQVSLTPAGLELLPKARTMMEELAASLDHVREQGKRREERVAIGCLPTIAAYQMPRVLREFAKSYPNVSVKIHDNSAMEIARLVQGGLAEFGITIVSVTVSDLEVRPLAKEPFVLLCTKNDPLARRRSASWAQLEGTPLIRISPQAGNRVLIDDALGHRRETLNWRYEVQHLQTAVGMVLERVGIAIVPQIAANMPGFPGLVAVPLRNPSIHRMLGVLLRRGLPLSGRRGSAGAGADAFRHPPLRRR